MGQVIAVVSGKGGTGKTSVCAAVASCLAAEGSRVLCVDADVGLRNLDLALGAPELSVFPFTELLRGTVSPEDIPEHPGIPNLFFLTAPMTEPAESIDPAAFASFMAGMRQRFDYCMIDSPAGVGAGFRLACAAADRILVVAGGDPASLRDASSVSALLGDREPGAVKLVVNRIVPRVFSGMKRTVDDIMDETGLPLLGLVPEDAAVTLSAAAGKPLVLYSAKGAARACLNLARRLRGQTVPLMRF